MSERKENSKKSAKEADAIHSYLTGVDTIRPFMNKSFIDPDSMPGNLSIDKKTGQLNVTQVKTAAAPILPMLPGLFGGGSSAPSNAQKSKALKILKRLFDSLNIVFKPKKLSVDKDFETKGQVNVGKNIVIGGAAGALPPIIGWTIATNSLSFEPITFFLIIFYWTPSHFWALSLYTAKDY